MISCNLPHRRSQLAVNRSQPIRNLLQVVAPFLDPRCPTCLFRDLWGLWHVLCPLNRNRELCIRFHCALHHANKSRPTARDHPGLKDRDQ